MLVKIVLCVCVLLRWILLIFCLLCLSCPWFDLRTTNRSREKCSLSKQLYMRFIVKYRRLTALHSLYSPPNRTRNPKGTDHQLPSLPSSSYTFIAWSHHVPASATSPRGFTTQLWNMEHISTLYSTLLLPMLLEIIELYKCTVVGMWRPS